MDKELKVLVFGINDELYATDISEVERILGYEKPTKVPDVEDFVVGVIEYQGEVLPIISIAKKFNLPLKEFTEETKIIIVNQNEQKIGIIVENVSEVKNINSDLIDDPPEIVSGVSKRYLKGIIKLDNKIILFLDLANVLTDGEKDLLNK